MGNIGSHVDLTSGLERTSSELSTYVENRIMLSSVGDLEFRGGFLKDCST